jgi:hypothetical protein
MSKERMMLNESEMLKMNEKWQILGDDKYLMSISYKYREVLWSDKIR